MSAPGLIVSARLEQERLLDWLDAHRELLALVGRAFYLRDDAQAA